MATKQTKYPTKNKIINCKVKPTKNDIKITTTWKKTTWKKSKNTKEKKIKAIKILIKLLSKKYNKKPKIIFNPKFPSACYNRIDNRITLNNYSIITALHELGHTIYGNSELKACSWSIKVFQQSFPVAFDKLHWEGHQLKK